MDPLLALQLATDKGNLVFNRRSSIISQSDSRFASQPNCSHIAEKPTDTYPDCSKRALMQASPDAVLEPRDSLTQIDVQNAEQSRVLSLATVVMAGNQWRERVGQEN